MDSQKTISKRQKDQLCLLRYSRFNVMATALAENAQNQKQPKD